MESIMKGILHKKIATSSKLCEGYRWGNLMISLAN